MQGNGRGRVNNGPALSQWLAVPRAGISALCVTVSLEGSRGIQGGVTCNGQTVMTKSMHFHWQRLLTFNKCTSCQKSTSNSCSWGWSFLYFYYYWPDHRGEGRERDMTCSKGTLLDWYQSSNPLHECTSLVLEERQFLQVECQGSYPSSYCMLGLQTGSRPGL